MRALYGNVPTTDLIEEFESYRERPNESRPAPLAAELERRGLIRCNWSAGVWTTTEAGAAAGLNNPR